MDRNKILKALTLLERSKITLELVDSIHSTNDYLKDRPSHPEIDSEWQILIANQQTQGRGRFGNVWFGPSGENIYLSCQKYFKKPISELSSLSLVVSLATVQALESFIKPAQLMIKWPNDILYKDSKLSGNLVEIMPLGRVIIGIGININMLTDEGGISKAWTSLKKIAGIHFDRNEIAAALVSQLLCVLSQFEQHGFTYFKEKWASYDRLMGHEINLKSDFHQGTIVQGVAKGLNDQGHLLLELEEGRYQAFASGDTSMIKLVYY